MKHYSPGMALVSIDLHQITLNLAMFFIADTVGSGSSDGG
jgi:hypothetical protein